VCEGMVSASSTFDFPKGRVKGLASVSSICCDTGKPWSLPAPSSAARIGLRGQNALLLRLIWTWAAARPMPAATPVSSSLRFRWKIVWSGY